jgi:hypothetical protein
MLAIRWAAVPVVVLTLGCSPKTEGPSVTTTSEGQKSEAPAGVTAAKKDVALVRFVNADPRSKLDVMTAKDPLFTNVAFKAVTPFMETARGYAQFRVQPPGSPKELSSARRELFPGRHYTVIAFPQKKGGDVILTLSDNLGKIDPGGVRLRLINATADIDDLELYIAGEPKPLLRGIDAGKTASFVDMEPGTVEIRAPEGKVYPKFTNLKVEANHLYTFIALGSGSDPDVVQIADRVEDMIEP